MSQRPSADTAGSAMCESITRSRGVNGRPSAGSDPRRAAVTTMSSRGFTIFITDALVQPSPDGAHSATGLGRQPLPPALRLRLMLSADDLSFFTVVAVSTSLAAASRVLDVTPSAITQRLRQIERKLDVRLVNRTG